MPDPTRVVGFRPEHRPGLIELWRRHFGDWVARGFDRRWDWQFTSNPFCANREPAIFIAEREGRVVGGLASNPVPMRIQGQKTIALCGGALAVDEGSRGHCLDLVRRLAKMPPAFAGGFHPSVRRILKSLDFAFIPTTCRRFVLRVRNDGLRCQRARRHVRRALTPLISPRLMSILPAFAFGSDLPPLSPIPATSHKGDIRVIDRFGADYDAFWARAGADIPNTVERTSAYMNWRYVDCPTQHAVRLGLYENGELRAVAIGLARMEPDWTGRPCAMHGEIAELMALEPESPGAEALLVRLLHELDARHRVDAYATLGLAPALHGLLRRLGFRDSSDEEFAMVVSQSRSRAMDDSFLNEGSWYATAADADALYAATI